MPPATDRPKKLQRISQACDVCHRRSIRCRPSAEDPRTKCQNCYDFGVDCTYNRPSRRRRNPSERHASPGNPPPSAQQQSLRTREPPLQTRSSAPLARPDDAPSAHPELSHYTVTSQGSLDLTGAYTLVRERRTQVSFDVSWRAYILASAAAIHEYLQIYMEVIYPVYPVRLLDTYCPNSTRADRCTAYY
nr:putative transcriptional regulatory protein c16g5.16 [Quercus suber]